MKKGWIKIHRKILDSWVSSEPELLAVWVRFLLKANHKQNKTMINGSLVTIERGELIFGLKSFTAETNVSVCKLRRFLKLLKTNNLINIVNKSKYSIITIVNYDDHQDVDIVIDKQTASKQQANSKQITTLKECKNVKNVKNERIDICQQIADAWNDKFPELSQVLKLTQKRKSAINGCIKEMKTTKHDFTKIETWIKLFDYASGSDFLMGKNGNNWTMTFDFVITKSKLIKIIEGDYDNA